MVNTTFAYQTTGSVNIKANGVFAVYVTDLLLSFFTLRRMCQKQICSNPFFRPLFCVERLFPGYSGFPLSRLKTNISRLHSDQEWQTKNHYVDVLPLNLYLFKYLFVLHVAFPREDSERV